MLRTARLAALALLLPLAACGHVNGRALAIGFAAGAATMAATLPQPVYYAPTYTVQSHYIQCGNGWCAAY